MADIDRSGNKNFTVGIMKTNCWLIFGMMVATGALAQNNTNALPPIPPPITSPAAEVAPVPAPVVAETNAPAVKHIRHKRHIAAAPKRIAKIPFAEPTVALVPGVAEVAVNNLNVRGQAGLRGEFLTRLNKGDAVTVLSQIDLDKHRVGEPAQWAKITLPVSTKVWVRAQFIDATNKTVLPKKLNLRAGPSENFSVIGVLERGTAVNEIITRNEWTRIEPPTNAYAFVAAMYLKQESSGTLATNLPPSTETEPMVTTNSVSEPAPIVTEPADTNAPAIADTNAPAMIDTNPPPPPRVVTHEGVVRHVTSIIEPTDYELYDPKSGGEIDYLYSTTTNLDLGVYNGMRIVVTGEEGLVERWKNTPMLTVERIEVMDTNVFTPNHVASPRGSQSH
jgi:uncharacterized protein YgiM (DUF1202 family)